VNSLQRSISEI
jgi:hypothetical protein